MVKYTGNCILGRRLLSGLFGKTFIERTPDAECWELENFVDDVMRVQLLMSVYRFINTPGVTPAMWQHWFNHKANGLPVVEKQGATMMWTWIKSSRQMGDWVPLGQSCPIVYQLVEREDGKGFNKVRVELVAPSYEISL